MNHDTEVLSWVIEYACSKGYPDLITACHSYLSEEEQENLPPLATLYNMLATLGHICKSEDFHANEQLRFILMIQSATLIFNIEEKMKAFLGGKSPKTGAADLLEECYYQAVLCFTTKQELLEGIAAEEATPSQQVSDTKYMDEVLEGIKNIVAARLKSKKIPKAMLDEHDLADFESQLNKYVEDNKALLPIPTLVQLSKKRHPPQIPTDIKPYTLDELYFAWDGHDIEWQMLQDFTHPDIKTFYRNNPNMPKEIRDYVKSLPDNKDRLQKIKTQSGSPTTPHFSHSKLSSPSPSSSKSPSGTFSFKPISQHLKPSQSSNVDEKADELGEVGGGEEEEKEEEEKGSKKKNEVTSQKRKRADSNLGKDLMQKSKRLHAIGEDPLVAALEYGNQIRKMLNESKNKEDEGEKGKEKSEKKKTAQESDESEEEQNNKKQKTQKKQKSKTTTKKTTKKTQKDEEDSEQDEEESEIEKPTKKTQKKGKNKSASDEEEEEEEEEVKPKKAQNGSSSSKKTKTVPKKGKKEESEEEKEEEEEEEEDVVVVGSTKSSTKKVPSPKKAKTASKKGKKDESDVEELEESPKNAKKPTPAANKGKKKADEESDDEKGDDKNDDSDDSDSAFFGGARLRLKSPKKGPKIKIAKRKFSIAEEQYLHKGVERFGVGKWKEILMSYNFNNRTAVDLKDKWRNIQKNKKG
eukprot:Phypoly_transcript_03980.p1 GENE.Phypoly_transcript_03980~~Phypoly_transcript_03980.p1  ORF type:complete len:693 (+),score=217.82 Phypoly_transcript_03980:86-2164(+)